MCQSTPPPGGDAKKGGMYDFSPPTTGAPVSDITARWLYGNKNTPDINADHSGTVNGDGTFTGVTPTAPITTEPRDPTVESVPDPTSINPLNRNPGQGLTTPTTPAAQVTTGAVSKPLYVAPTPPVTPPVDNAYSGGTQVAPQTASVASPSANPSAIFSTTPSTTRTYVPAAEESTPVNNVSNALLRRFKPQDWRY